MGYKDILRRRAKKSILGKNVGKLSPYQIIGTPLFTEKAYKQVEKENVYTFRVHKDANKNDIKRSLNVLYGVRPISVRLLRVPAKGRAYRKLVRRSYKKAIVTLKSGDKIELVA